MIEKKSKQLSPAKSCIIQLVAKGQTGTESLPALSLDRNQECDCDEISQGSSELDFSVFDTDIVQIAAYNNEGYYRINDVLGGGKEIIQAVTKSSEIAIEARESDKKNFQGDDGGYEYISVKNVPSKLSTTVKDVPPAGIKPKLKYVPPTHKNFGSIKREPPPLPTPSRKISANSKNISQTDSSSTKVKGKVTRPVSDSGYKIGISQQGRPRAKQVSRSDICLTRIVKSSSQPQRDRSSINETEVSRSEKESTSKSLTPPLPPRQCHGRKRIYQTHSESRMTKITAQPKRNTFSNKQTPNTDVNSATRLTKSTQSVNTVSDNVTLEPNSDSNATVYWEIGDVNDGDEAIRRNSSSSRQSINERQVVAAIDFGTTYSSWGYSLRDDFLSDPGDIIVKRWEFGKTSMFKAPTCILLSPDGSKVEAFGFDAERMFAALVKQGRHRDYYFFFRFKLELQKLINKVQGIKRHFELNDITGKVLPATKVFAHAIRWLKEDLAGDLKQRHLKTFQDDEIHWVLSIPAVWSRTAKQFMRDAAKQAELYSKQLSIVLEPEACSIVCHHEAGKQIGIDLVKAGSQYVIVDAAGGTVDLMAVEIDANNSPRIISSSYQVQLGAINVDSAFEKLFKDIHGISVFNRFVESNFDDYMELMYNFETAKRSAKVHSGQDVEFAVPTSLIKIYRERTAKELDTNKVIKHLRMRFSQNKLHCDAALFKELFKDVCAGIVDNICELLERDRLSCVKAIILTGGFSESEILQQIVKESFTYLHVLVLKDASLSVLKGAIMCGHLHIA